MFVFTAFVRSERPEKFPNLRINVSRIALKFVKSKLRENMLSYKERKKQRKGNIENQEKHNFTVSINVHLDLRHVPN